MSGVVVGLWALAVAAFVGVGIGIHGAWNRPPEVIRVAIDSDSSELELTWVGDVMLGAQAQPLLERHGYEWPFQYVRHMLDGDLVIANAESMITDRSEPYDTSQHWHYNSLPPTADAYAAAGIDVLGLANNHAMDRGPDGLADMLRHSAEAGMLAFGAGMNVSEAERPLLVESPVGTVGIVGLGKYYGPHKMAKADQAGTIALSRAAIERGYDLARRAGADWVVGYVQWGRAYADVNHEQESFAQEFASAGYDLVIGHHPHVTHPITVVDGMPVVYSLGNFVFGTPGRFSPNLPGIGLVVTTQFTTDGLSGMAIRCVETDNTVVEYQSRPCSPETAAETLGTLHRDVVVTGDVAQLDLTPERLRSRSGHIIWVGDTMVGDAAQSKLDRHGYTWPFEHVSHLLDGGAVIANAESAITERTEPFDPSQQWDYNSLPPAAEAYRAVGIDVLGLANNHAMDRGPQGLSDTLRLAKAAGLETFGAGTTVVQAEAVVLVEVPAGIVGIVGFAEDYGDTKVASGDQAGTSRLHDSAIVRAYRAAATAGADWVVASVHWGENYAEVLDEQRAWAEQFAAAGYDLVIGHHPHVVQDIEVIDGMPVVYSLGNFVFNTPGRFTTARPGYGLVVRSEFDDGGLAALELRCIVTDNEIVTYQPRPCSSNEAIEVLQGLHSQIELDRDVARLDMRPHPDGS
jgi:poly-gamma-glutamate capsule biosynthesis protein CapA/YwtB (metallophosphatase superfamily)